MSGKGAEQSDAHRRTILDPAPEARFDRFTRLAARATGSSLAYLSLAHEEAQRVVSSFGIDRTAAAHATVLCAHAIEQDAVFAVHDLGADARFAALPCVAGAPHLRFCAGAPLRTPDGRRIGVLAVADTTPRALSDEEGEMLVDLASAVMEAIETLRRAAEHGDLNELQRARHECIAAEQSLRNSQARFAALVEHSSEVVTLLSLDGTVQYQSPSIRRVLGYDAHELEGRNVLGLIHPEDLPVVLRHIEMLAAGAHHVTCETRFLSKEAGWRWLEISATDLTGDEAVQAIVLNSRDVTDRKTDEARLLQRDRLLEMAAHVAQILTTAPDASAGIAAALALVGQAARADRVYVFENHHDAEGRLLTSQRYEWCRSGIVPQLDNPWLQNQPFDDLLGGWADGLLAGEAVAVNVRDLSTPIRAHLEAQAIRSLLAVPVVVGNEWLGVVGLDDCTSERAWSSAEHAVLATVASMIGGVIQRRRFEDERAAHVEAVATSEQRFRSLVEATTMVVWRADVDGHITELGNAWTRFTGQTPEQVCGWGWAGALHPEDRGQIAAEWTAHLASGKPYACEYRVRRADGVYQWFAGHAVPVQGPDGRLLEWVGTCTNVDEKKRTLARLVESEARFRTLAETLPQLVWTAEPDGTIDYYNGRIDAFAGAERAPDGAWRWYPILHEDDRVRSADAWARAVRTGEPYEFEHRALLKEGGYRWFLSRGLPVRSADGNITKWYGTTTDIHDQKLAQEEMRRAKEEAEEMSRLKSSFLTNMSHEIRTPLTAVLGYSDLLADEVSETGRMFAGMIRQSGERLLATLNSVLDLAQLESKTLRLNVGPVDVAEQARQVVELFVVQARHCGTELRLASAPSLTILSDPAIIGRILTNLMSNAVKFTPNGHILVRTSLEEDAIVLQVADTGIGISPDFLPHLFDEFRQESEGLSRDYEGTGLGLAITRRLVDLLHGTISVESTKGRGTTFTVRLPRTEPRRHIPSVRIADETPRAPEQTGG